jgi:hydroxyacylglutathione hydrolase
VSPVSPVVRIKNGEVSANTYLYRLDSVGTCLLIDPGLDGDAIEATLLEHSLTPSAIICTHGHFDHLGSAERFRRRYSIPVYLGQADAKIARASNFMMMALKLRSRIVVPEVFEWLDEDLMSGFGARLEVVRVPGHTRGSVAFHVGDSLFTGDTMYRDDTWRVRWPEEDGVALIDSLHRLWESVSDDTHVYPGHGGGATFGSIKQHNTSLRRMLGVEEVAGR